MQTPPQPQSPDQESRMAAARAKADAARAAVERRRSMSSGNVGERSHSGYPEATQMQQQQRSASVGSFTAGAECTGEVIIKRRLSSGAATPNCASTPTAGMGGSGTPYRSSTPTGAVGGAAAAEAPAGAPAVYHEAPAAAEAVAAHADPAAHQTPEYYAAQIAAMRAEKARIAQHDRELAERMQIYSEVVGLRKELAVVKEDEERLRKQLAATAAVIADNDPAAAKEVAIFEDEAQQSTLQKLYAQESEHHNPDTMEWAEIDVSDLRQRIQAAHAKFVAASEKADGLYAQQEEAINETTDAREREKAAIAENHEREMESLDEARAHARQVASEQHFHRHRGTSKAPPTAVPKEKKVATRQRGIDEVEFRTTAQVSKMKDELAELMEQVKQLKRTLDDSRETTETKRRECEAALKVVEDEGAEAREMKEKLLREEEELKELKADIQGVLHYVRAKNREEEGW